jgi:hypothetical protein
VCLILVAEPALFFPPFTTHAAHRRPGVVGPNVTSPPPNPGEELSMSLLFHRYRLAMQLLKGDAAYQPPEADLTLEMIDTWFNLYKKWEAADTFLTAFREKRMTVRQSPKSQTYDANFKARHESLPQSDGTYGMKKYSGQKYATGIDSLKERLNPRNFELTPGNEKGKYKHGLHDLSGSLLDPDKPTISDQLRWKDFKNVAPEVRSGAKFVKWYVIFMPMAQPEDLGLFHPMNSASKRLRSVCPDIYYRVVDIRQRMSRIKLAEEDDMGCGLIDVARVEAPAPKFRYGLKNPLDAQGRLSPIDQERRRKALHYTSILALQREKKSTSNEIVIAYRKHAGARFPLFTQWNEERAGFICLEDEATSASVKGGFIPDKWQQTVEA